MAEKEKVRIDKYLWAIRIFKTRALASEACEKGRVRMQGNSLKASKHVNIGEEYEIKADARKWIIKVVDIIHNRVAYSEAITHYIDLTPAEELDLLKQSASSFHTGKRLSKIGRPTKKERRDIDDFTEQ
jgi:ribosome-associated heat shock protein Hsp15